MGGTFPGDVERESYRAPALLVVLACALAALATTAFAVTAVDDLAALARGKARRRSEVDATFLEVRDRVRDSRSSGGVLEAASAALEDPRLAEKLEREGVVAVTVVDGQARPLGAPHRLGAAVEPLEGLEEVVLPLDEGSPTRAALRLQLVRPETAIEGVRSVALGRFAAAGLLGLALVGAASFGATRLVRRERQRSRATRARERLARLGVLAGGLARELEPSLLGVREALLVLKERLPEDLPHLDDQLCPGELCECAASHLSRAEAVLRDFTASARPEPAPPRVADVASLVRDWSRSLEVELAAHGIGLLLEGAVSPASAVVDPSGLKRIFWSLVRNARDAAPHGSLVRVSLVRDADRIRLRVTDVGPGIEALRREEVFEPLLSTKPWGTGLGLAISRRLAEAMGARLAVVGGPPGAVLELSLRPAPLTIPLDWAAPHGWASAV